MPALVVLTSLFFMWGLITSLNDILIPHLKAIFTLSYVQAMLIQFCFFGAYFVMSFPSGFLVEKLGYRKRHHHRPRRPRASAVSASIRPRRCSPIRCSSARCSCWRPASRCCRSPRIPYVAMLGKPETAASRLNLTQAFNSLGTTVGPFMGSVLILAAVVGRRRDRRRAARSRPCRARISLSRPCCS